MLIIKSSKKTFEGQKIPRIFISKVMSQHHTCCFVSASLDWLIHPDVSHECQRCDMKLNAPCFL